MSDFELISLDLETSSSDPEHGTILSVGCVRFDPPEIVPRDFYREVKHKSLEVTPEAMRVNGLDITTIDSPKKLSLVEVDIKLRTWLWCGDIKSKNLRFIPMGLNVGSFDMAFVRKYLPLSAKAFGYRSLDYRCTFCWQNKLRNSNLHRCTQLYSI